VSGEERWIRERRRLFDIVGEDWRRRTCWYCMPFVSDGLLYARTDAGIVALA
jgi:hypothetical protein